MVREKLYFDDAEDEPMDIESDGMEDVDMDEENADGDEGEDMDTDSEDEEI